MSDTAHSLAVDLGGTNTRVALVAPDGTVRARDEEPTARKDQHPDELIEHIRRVANGHQVDVAVAGVPGRVDHRIIVVQGSMSEHGWNSRRTSRRPGPQA